APMRFSLGSRWRAILSKFVLLLFGTCIGLTLAEGSVRLLEPDLKDVVEANFERHSYRIHANPRNTVAWRKHPDSGVQHPVIFNSLGLRQHREFPDRRASGSTRIGFFGDSFTANLRLPIHDSFTESLDFLLKQSGLQVEVMNLGTDGYGTDQLLLHYLDAAAELDLDAVYYVFCQNDLRDILANELFEISPSGDLRYRPRRQPQIWVDLARRFHLTYFVARRFVQIREKLAPTPWDRGTILDAEQEKTNRRRLSQILVAEPSPEKTRALELFRALMQSFHDATQQNGQSLRVVLLPRYREANLEIQQALGDLGIKTLDLFPRFFPDAEALEARASYFFRTDSHWNAAGNVLAAKTLFAEILPQRGRPVPPDAVVEDWLRRYRAAFVDGSADPPGGSPSGESIRSTYGELRPDSPSWLVTASGD
ncbi:MAG: hypothetical protein AAGM22_31230, partial [Acidobacteriota bacterium]